MKKAILYSAMALATLTMSSCGDDFLVIDPAGSVSEGTLMTEEGINYVLTGAYATFNNMTQAQWMGGASLTNHFYGDIAGGDANKGSQSADQPDLVQIEIFGFNAGNSYPAGKWNAVYEGVKRANNVISMANRMGDALPNKDQIIGQALFIKSVWNFEGIMMFGAAIPYVTLEAYEAATDPDVSNVDESGNYVYIWSNVEADLKEAISKLPATWTSTGEYGRATSWQAKALLAKLYLYWSSPYNGTNGTNTSKMAEAKSMLKDIIDNGVDAKGQKYKLISKYGDLFDANADDCDWGGESVFDIQTTISGTQTDTNTPWYGPAVGQPGASGIGGWGFYQPTYDFAQNHIVDANGLPLSESEYRAIPRLTLMDSNGTPQTDLSVAVDPRLDFTIGRFGVPYLDWGTPTTTNGWVRDFTNGGLYMNKKPQPYIADRGSKAIGTTAVSSTKNAHIIRYADILLMYAECCIADGDLSTPLQIINQIRTRAANDFIAADATTKGTYTLDDKVNGTTKDGAAGNYRIGLYTSFGSAAEATQALRTERRIELGMEGHRWYDLVRWGVAPEVLNSYVNYEGQFFAEKYTNAYGSKMVTFPIPSTQIVNGKGRIVQNENWK